MLTTRFTETFGIEHPIVCGGMTAIGTADLIGPVAESGALGFLTALTQPTPEALTAEIARVREMTDKPFGVNLTILPTIQPVPYDEYRDAIIESGIKIVETAGSNPAPHLPGFKAAGVKIIHKAVTVRHALKGQALGVDAISIDGYECAGHPGNDDVGGLVLIPAAARVLDIPVIASGGIADARGIAGALALGADAVNMGTRFVATAEAPIHENVKAQIVDNDETATQIVFREFGNTARVARNSISEEIVRLSALDGATFDDVAELAVGARARQNVLTEGRMEDGMWWASQAQGLIHDVPAVGEMVARLIEETELILRRLAPA